MVSSLNMAFLLKEEDKNVASPIIKSGYRLASETVPSCHSVSFGYYQVL